MYDLKGLEADTDDLWAALRDALRAEELAAPEALSRDLAEEDLWTEPELCLAQACGLPLVTGRCGDATVLGAFDFALPGCGAGQYNSVLIAAAGVGDLVGNARFAFNGRGSQSGYAALRRHMGARLGEGVETGAHLASIRAVAEGRADIAAIDAVSWRLAHMVVPRDTAGVREIGATPPTPGLPLITAPGRDPGPYRRAIAAAVSAYASGRNRLGLAGFVPFDRSDYTEVIWPVD